MALEITYKGTQIAQLTTNGNLTLETAGKYCEGNIGIVYTGGGFDANGAVLKVITSTDCTILVTGTNYSETHQQADGFPRSSDANVTEHFFSIPTTAFGTITVKATNTYGNNTKTITVDTTGKIYEILVSAPNIILDSTFGLQSGFLNKLNLINGEYSERDKNIQRINASTELSGNIIDIPVGPYSTLTVTAQRHGSSAIMSISLEDQDDRTLCLLTFNRSGSITASDTIDNKYYATATLKFNYVYKITEIVLS